MVTRPARNALPIRTQLVLARRRELTACATLGMVATQAQGNVQSALLIKSSHPMEMRNVQQSVSALRTK